MKKFPYLNIIAFCLIIAANGLVGCQGTTPTPNATPTATFTPTAVIQTMKMVVTHPELKSITPYNTSNSKSKKGGKNMVS